MLPDTITKDILINAPAEPTPPTWTRFPAGLR